MHAKITFSVNEYDKDGDVTETGIFLHFGETRVKACNTVADFSELLQHFEHMRDEIETEYRQ